MKKTKRYMKDLKMIVATDMMGGIGKNNKLPWPRNTNDMNWLHEKTKDAILIVGAKTYFSLPPKMRSKVFNGNDFVVISRDAMDNDENTFFCNIDLRNKDKAFSDISAIVDSINTKKRKRNVFVFGGALVYSALLPYVDEVYISTFQNIYDCDVIMDRDAIINHARFCSYRDDSDKDVVFEIFHTTLEAAKEKAPYFEVSEAKLNKLTNFLKG